MANDASTGYPEQEELPEEFAEAKVGRKNDIWGNSFVSHVFMYRLVPVVVFAFRKRNDAVCAVQAELPPLVLLLLGGVPFDPLDHV